MKINRFVALAAIAVLAVAALSAFSLKVSAQISEPAVPAQNCDAEDDDAAETEDDGPDLDDVELECGDQDEDDDEDEFEDEDAPLGSPAITAEAAQQAAEAYLDAGTASEVELENENGKLVYSVEIGSSEVEVDAMTGEVLGVEADED